LPTHRMTSTYSEIDDSCRKCRKHPRKSHTDRTDIHIWFFCELERIRTATEHLGVRLHSDVGLESHDEFVFFWHFIMIY
jgi:hypothetical protein